jgi:hypothetical protein
MFRAIITATVVASAAMLYAQGNANAATIYCAYYNDGSKNCGFYTLKECRADVRGVGGYCRKRR